MLRCDDERRGGNLMRAVGQRVVAKPREAEAAGVFEVD
jgi:hypothetical protein